MDHWWKNNQTKEYIMKKENWKKNVRHTHKATNNNNKTYTTALSISKDLWVLGALSFPRLSSRTRPWKRPGCQHFRTFKYSQGLCESWITFTALYPRTHIVFHEVRVDALNPIIQDGHHDVLSRVALLPSADHVHVKTSVTPSMLQTRRTQPSATVTIASNKLKLF